MRYGLVLAVLCLVGCSSLETRVDYGYVAQYAIGDEANSFSEGVKHNGDPYMGLPLDGHYLFGGLGFYTEDDGIRADLLLGPSLIIPTSGPDSDWVGAELRMRLGYTALPVHPFIEGFAGVGWVTGDRWWGQGTRHLYSVGGTVGIVVPLGEEWSVDAGYRFHHLSNGSAIFGTHKPNAGYNGDMVIIGIRKTF